MATEGFNSGSCALSCKGSYEGYAAHTQVSPLVSCMHLRFVVAECIHIMQGQIKTPLGSKAQQVANQRNTMTKYFPVLHDGGHSNEVFPIRERLLPALPHMQVST